MIPENLIFISAAPLDTYFAWQYEVLITNFRKFGISDKVEIIIWFPQDRIGELEQWKVLETKYPEVKFFYYEDAGVNLGLYIPQLRPHSLKKHFLEHKDRLKGKMFFYHDSDILFTRLPDFEKLCQDDGTCWESDCSGYLDYDYMRSKEVQGKMPEHEGIQIMAEIGGVTVDIIKSYNKITGGAQYILKDIDHTFWEDVERMCIEIRQKFFHGMEGSVNRKYFSDENAGWQSWCADMWAVNFSLWKRNIRTNITDELAFSWATDSDVTYHQKPIFHNAGVTGQMPHLFYKGKYISSSPIGLKIPSPPKNTASYYYWQAIQDVK